MQNRKWDDVPLEEVNPTLSRKLVWGERIMLAQVFMRKGCIVPTHAHESEQFTQVFSGRPRLWVGQAGEEQEVTLEPGEVLVIPSWVPHRAEALEDTLDVDVFSPVRKDWIDGSDAYLRR